uniref:Uncharacterized protein n=1 Tax=Anopheles maculatus TaxID=74869 RepID=A0A182TCD8_9DIPT
MARPVVVWRRLTVLLTVLCLHGVIVPTEQHATVVRHGFPPSILHVEPDIDTSRRTPRTITLSLGDMEGDDGADPEVAALLARSPFLRDELKRVRRDTATPNVNSGGTGQNKNVSTTPVAASGPTAGSNVTAAAPTTSTKNTVSSEFTPAPIIKAKGPRTCTSQSTLGTKITL